MGLLTIKGKILKKKKGEQYYSVEIPELDIFTQGEDHDDCVEMAIDSIETLLEDEGEVDIEFLSFDANDSNTFYLTSDNPGPLYSRFLYILRSTYDLTQREVADRLGDQSHNSYAQYEQGKHIPSVVKFQELVNAITDGEQVVTLGLAKVNKKKNVA
jgi:predicted RNase H-like HicB family nuclease